MLIISLCACSRVTPGARWPNVCSGRALRFCSSRPLIWLSGIHTSVLNGNWKPSGTTPMIVVGTSLMRTVRPITDGLLPYRFTHTLWPISATEGAPGRSSSGTKSRPITGRAPSTPNVFAVTFEPL